MGQWLSDAHAYELSVRLKEPAHDLAVHHAGEQLVPLHRAIRAQAIEERGRGGRAHVRDAASEDRSVGRDGEVTQVAISAAGRKGQHELPVHAERGVGRAVGGETPKREPDVLRGRDVTRHQ